MLYWQRNKSLTSSISELDKLKNLLLGEELKQLKELESKLKRLDLESQDEETIIARVMPLFDHILLERLQNKDDRTIKILSDHLAQIITETYKHDSARLSQSLQHVIGPAISKEIASNKNAMIDTLYPIMGGMISKYVTQAIKEMMEKINNKIEDGLSFDKYRRKIKSKITGVSETELLLEESNNALISSLFVLEKESGMLIAEAHFEDKEIDDPHMVASMASAIKDFINDWMQSKKKQSEIQILSYGNATLYIESAGSVYIIAFLDTEPDHELRSDINIFFASVVKEYAAFFQKFDGDDSVEEIGELSKKMKVYLHTQQIAEKSSLDISTQNPVKYIVIAFGIILLIALGYYTKDKYIEYQLEKKIKNDTGYSIDIESEDEKFILRGKVKSFEDAKNISNIVKKISLKPIVNSLDMSILDIKQEAVKQETKFTKIFNKQLENVQKKHQRNTEETEERINKKLEKLKVHFMFDSDEKATQINILKQQELAIARIARLQEKIIRKLSIAFASDEIFNYKDGSLDFTSGDLFGAGDGILNEDLRKTIKNSFEIYITQLLKDKEIKKYIKAIVIEGHTDSSGKLSVNQRLSKERADQVKKYLLTLDKSKDLDLRTLLLSKGLSSTQPILKNGIEDKKASRRIKIKFILDKNKMIQEIGKILI